MVEMHSFPSLLFPLFTPLSLPFFTLLSSFLSSLLIHHACMHPVWLELVHMHMYAGVASLPQLAHLFCSTSLVCINGLAYSWSGTLGLHFSRTGTIYSCCVHLYVSVTLSFRINCVHSLYYIYYVYGYAYYRNNSRNNSIIIWEPDN